MYSAIKDQLQDELGAIRAAGLFKIERHIDSPQASHVIAGQLGQDGTGVLNFCANNYLGLADHPQIIEAAKTAMDQRGFGMASVRFICGTQDLHLELERRVSEFLGTEDTILFSSCFDANGGVFESLFTAEDAIISDALNHASIIDGIRLCKARRYRYANRDMQELEAMLIEASSGENPARRKIVVTDGVFSMDGYLAPLEAICDLAEKYDALVMVDDSHAVGFMGPTGAGTPEHAGVSQRVDIYTGTFGKALGGASGGYVSGRAEIVDMLRQKARPYLFSNSLAPAIVAATIKALELVVTSAGLRERLFENAALFRQRMAEEGFELLEGEHAIVPVMFGDAVVAARVADDMLRHGVFVTAFSYPVVPKGAARIRVQLSAAHSSQDVEACVQAFVKSRASIAAKPALG
jgi:glycine C-acetyltransferase